MNKKLIAAIAAGALIVAGGVGVAATAATTPDVQRAYVSVEEPKLASVVEPVAVETPEPTVEPAPVVEQPAPAPAPAPPAPVKCPAGTTAGQVDSAGNESLCASTGPEGQQCAEYNGNECVSWLKP